MEAVILLKNHQQVKVVLVNEDVEAQEHDSQDHDLSVARICSFQRRQLDSSSLTERFQNKLLTRGFDETTEEFV